MLDIFRANLYDVGRMADSITVNAPAKINIGLQVFPRRADGYHDIQSVFTTVGLYDTLTVSLSDREGTCIVECEGMELPPENTFTLAYKAFCVLSGIKCGVRVNVVKRIPSGGGLGGGSSDASSFIQSIDRLCGTHLKAGDLQHIAGQVGSDVFFFTQALLSGSEHFTAVVEGRGEKVSQIKARCDYSVVLVFPNVCVSTREAYSWVDEEIVARGFSIEPSMEMEGEYRKPITLWRFKNDFTVPVSVRHTEIAEAIAGLKNCGADFADMSGSGSTVFGLFVKKGHEACAPAAVRAADFLAGRWQTVLA